jgi:hypothetical protein
MTTIYGEIRQLNFDRAFLNIHNDFYGAIGVWGSSYSCITILAIHGHEFHLIQFKDFACYNEWLDDNNQYNYTITRLDNLEENV